MAPNHRLLGIIQFVSVISVYPYHSLVAEVRLSHVKRCERRNSHPSKNFAQNFASLIVVLLIL